MPPDFTYLKAGTIATPKDEEPDYLQPDDLAAGRVLAFDQTLGTPTSGGTGWVLLDKSVIDQQVVIVDCGFIKGKNTGMVKGNAMNLERSLHLYRTVIPLLIQYAVRPDVMVAYETPPAGGKMARPESSLMAAEAILIAADSLALQPPKMISAQRAKKSICGNPNADKPYVHKVLREQCFPWIGQSNLITNEAGRDALMVGLQCLKERKIERG